ncbi:YihY/virulence factor BrkB family protein [soil metagenome]
MPSGKGGAKRKPSRGLRDLKRDDLEKVAKASYARFGEIALTDRAATLAYYGFLSLFPGLIVGVALLALFGNYPETYESIIETLREAAPGTAVDTIDTSLRDVLQGGGAGGLLSFGLVFALVTASGAVGATIRALEAINGTRRSATFVRSNLTRLWLTLALMALFVVAFAALLIAGPLFGSISEAAGLGDTGRLLVRALRYPVGLGALLAALLLLYSRGPTGTRRRLSEHIPGALLAAALWVIASVGFSFYVSKFSSYNATYGALGAVIVLLVWIYVTAVAVLIGALANRELLRVRQAR